MTLYCGPHACFDCGSRLVSLCKLVRYRAGARNLRRREFAALRGRVGLVSFPRSGSTLMRLLLEQRTGLCTGSDGSLVWPLVFRLRSCSRSGMRYASRPGIGCLSFARWSRLRQNGPSKRSRERFRRPCTALGSNSQKEKKA